MLRNGLISAAGGVGSEFLVTQEFSSVVSTPGGTSADYSFSVTTSAPSSGREIYAVIPLITASGTDVISVTFGGNEMTEVYQIFNGARGAVSFWKISDDTNSSAILAVNVNNSSNHIGESVNVFSVYGASSGVTTAGTTSAASGSVSVSISSLAGDALLWGYATRNGTSVTVSSTPSLTVTENYDSDTNSGEFHASGYISPANMTSDLTQITRTTSALAAETAFGAIVLTPA